MPVHRPIFVARSCTSRVFIQPEAQKSITNLIIGQCNAAAHVLRDSGITMKSSGSSFLDKSPDERPDGKSKAKAVFSY
ncbi:hypothetical protein BaRGS_00023997 [Batillaria attramentaria]|uniref:Uncharacterized protein n=1 Tax=Batillaria attramentaria TaxID=370345 RepID=A0ABD0KCE1_9CAEN